MPTLHPCQKAFVAFLLLILASGCGVSKQPQTPHSKTKDTPEVIIRLIRDPVRTRPQHKMVLLPNPEEGRTGQMIVRTSGGSQTIDRAYLATEITAPDAAPSSPAEMSPETVQQIFGAALSALPDASIHIILYFKGVSSELNPESAALIPNIVSVIQQRQSSDISVVGHTDLTASESFNLKLSRERAEAVRRLLTDAGIPDEYLYVQYYGEKVPLIPTSKGVPEPRNRRAEVIVR